MNYLEEISRLKRQRDAVILAHYYEDAEIQDLADYIGDSFYLAKMGQQVPQKTILLAGVVFMAESVKIMNPKKTVLVPDLNAGCSLVDNSPADQYRKWREAHPKALAVTYINSSAEVKAISDVIITSSNAEQIINSIPRDREILFGPDQNLGAYLAKKLNRPMTLWPGSCQVHVLFSAKKLFELKKSNPQARILAHPECDEAVLNFSHAIGSTSFLLEQVKDRTFDSFIVATEPGIIHQMKKLRPDATIIEAPAEGSCACNVCPYMKLNTLEKIYLALRDLKPAVDVPEPLRQHALVPLQRMMNLSSQKTVVWPEEFHCSP